MQLISRSNVFIKALCQRLTREHVVGLIAKQLRLRPLALMLFVVTLLVALFGQGVSSEAGNVSYTYDAGGRLLAVFDGNGNVANYQYDPLGNLTAIVKSSASSVLVFGYSPDANSGAGQITIYGNNFSATPSQNIITFYDTNPTVVSSTTTQIVITAPYYNGLSSGYITVTSPGGSATGPLLYSGGGPPLGFPYLD